MIKQKVKHTCKAQHFVHMSYNFSVLSIIRPNSKGNIQMYLQSLSLAKYACVPHVLPSRIVINLAWQYNLRCSNQADGQFYCALTVLS
jgi:hypothetical protein